MRLHPPSHFYQEMRKCSESAFEVNQVTVPTGTVSVMVSAVFW